MGSSSVVGWTLLYAILALITTQQHYSNAALLPETLKLIEAANADGPYLGLVIPNTYELNPLLRSPNFTSTDLIIDFSGRRFRFGTIATKKVILVMTGLGMINAGITTQLLLSMFSVEGVVHYGTAGNANPTFNLADVVIPQYWSHTALWTWQRYGHGPEDDLPLNSMRDIGCLNLASYTVNVTDGSSYDNLLNNIWYQSEEVFPIDGTPEQRDFTFWVPVHPFYYEISKNLEKKMRISVVAWPCIAVYAVIISLMLKHTNDALSTDTQKLIDQANKSGPYLGLVILNSFELDPLLQSPNFTSTNLIIDFSGRRFRFGTIAEKKVILVMTGVSCPWNNYSAFV